MSEEGKEEVDRGANTGVNVAGCEGSIPTDRRNWSRYGSQSTGPPLLSWHHSYQPISTGSKIFEVSAWASTRPGTRWARESDGTLWTGESFCHCCPVPILSQASRLKEGPPQVVPIEMWATLPKGECIGSWENQLSMEGGVPPGRNHSTDKAITYPIGVGRGQDLYGVNPRARWRISFIWNSGPMLSKGWWCTQDLHSPGYSLWV